MGDHYATLGQDQLDVAQAETEDVIEAAPLSWSGEGRCSYGSAEVFSFAAS
jgi:hypothetical protein